MKPTIGELLACAWPFGEVSRAEPERASTLDRENVWEIVKGDFARWGFPPGTFFALHRRAPESCAEMVIGQIVNSSGKHWLAGRLVYDAAGNPDSLLEPGRTIDISAPGTWNFVGCLVPLKKYKPQPSCPN